MANRCIHELNGGGFREFLLLKLDEFRKTEQFTDVVLDCGGVRIPAHKNVLAASSQYFAAMFGGNFSESTQSEISLRKMDPQCMELLIDFIYTGRLSIEEEFVQQLFVTASFLQLAHAEDLCAEYMAQHLDASNWLGFKHFAGTIATVECLNLATNKSSMCENMSVKRRSIGAVVSNSAIYVMGGRNIHQTAERYDPRVRHWMELPSMSVVNSYCSSALVGEAIYFSGLMASVLAFCGEESVANRLQISKYRDWVGAIGLKMVSYNS